MSPSVASAASSSGAAASSSVSASSDRFYGYGHVSAVCTATITTLFAPSPPRASTSTPSSPGASSSVAFGQHGYPSPPPSGESSPQIGSDDAAGAASSSAGKRGKPATGAGAIGATAQWPAREGIDTPPHSPVVTQEATPHVPELMDFIAYALYRTRLPTAIVHSALLLLTRLKKLYPSARGTSTSPHRLFLSALMLASKMAMDDTYSNRSWCIVGQQLFTLPEVNRMERELFGFLGCNCCVGKEELDRWTEEWLAPGGIVGPEPEVRVSEQNRRVATLASFASRRTPEERKRRRSSPVSSSATTPASASSSTGAAAEERQRAASAAANALLNHTSVRTSSPAGSMRSSSAQLSSRLSTRGIAPAAVKAPAPASPSDLAHPTSQRPQSHFRQHASAGSVTSVPARSSLRTQASDSSMRSTASSSSSVGSALPSSACGSASTGSTSVGSSPSSVGGPWTPDVAPARHRGIEGVKAHAAWDGRDEEVVAERWTARV